MRKKTKIGTRFGVRHQHAVGETFVEHTTFEAEADALTTEQEAERRARVQLARCRKQKRGCKFVRAVSYRLAPLVELPEWERVSDEEFVIRHPDSGHLISARYFRGIRGAWLFTVGCHLDGVDRATADEARTVCEERLRELGYKVAKAKKGGAS